MTQASSHSVRPESAATLHPRFSRPAVGVGMVAGVICCLALQAAAGQMQAVLTDFAWYTATERADGPAQSLVGRDQTSIATQLLGAASAARTPQQTPFTKVLSGVSGEVFSPDAMRVALQQASIAGGDGLPASDAALANVAPAAWDRLSAGDCITLTTKAGQTLSFRIVGSRPASDPQIVDAQPKIDLAVTTCTGTGEPVAKAVIEPARQQPAKGAVAQRAL